MQAKINKYLEGLYSLDHNIKLYIPSTVNTSKQIDNSEWVKKTLTLFSGLFGGSTSYDAMGSWVSNKEGLIVEKITIVESYATREQVEKGLEQVVQYAKSLKNEFKQEAISLEYDNRLYFI